jgi:CMP-N-acetylneuraminic acid synthetase
VDIICPIFPETPSEADLLHTRFAGEPYLDHVLHRLCKVDDVRLHILTDNKEIYEHVSIEGFNVFWAGASGDNEANDGPFSHFKLPRLKKMIGEMSSEGTDKLVLMDSRFPLLTYSVLKKALAQYHQSNRTVLVSVSRPVDHPAQIETYFSHIGTDILSMIDEDFDANDVVEGAESRFGIGYPAAAFHGVCVSKPFFFHWEGYCIDPKVYNSLVYRVYDENLYSWSRPCSGADFLDYLTSPSIGKYYLFDHSQQARRLYPSIALKNDRGEVIKGLSFGKKLDSSICLVIGREGGTNRRICIRDEFIGKYYLMRIEPLMMPQREDSSDAFMIDIDRNIAGTHALSAFGENFHETDIQLDRLKPGHHWVVNILENMSCGTADISQPLQLENALWHTDSKTQKKYDPATGRELTGRQLLPMVYCLDGAILITDAAYLSKMESGIDFSDAEAFVLKNPISKMIASEIDFYRIPVKEIENDR